MYYVVTSEGLRLTKLNRNELFEDSLLGKIKIEIEFYPEECR